MNFHERETNVERGIGLPDPTQGRWAGVVFEFCGELVVTRRLTHTGM